MPTALAHVNAPLHRAAVLSLLALAAQAQNAWTDLGQALAGANGLPALVPHGPLAGNSQCVLELANARPSSFAFLVGGFSSLALPLAGGLLVPAPDYVSPAVATGTLGQTGFELNWPASVPVGTSAYFQWWVLDAGAAQGLAASNAQLGISQAALPLGNFAAHWIDGTACAADPLIQVQQYDADTFILRQSLCTNFEAPFMYLLFGQDKMLMQDTGNGGIPIQATVQSIIDSWLAAHGQASIQLIVSHSHSHGDHVKGDPQFAGKPNTTVVGTGQANVAAFFGLAQWPNGEASYDLGGGRVIDVLPIPGHESSHIALYDRRDGLLFTGDTLYPGRLYVSNFPAYVASLQHLVAFMDDKPIAHVLGTHIEMSGTAGVDFALGSLQHPHEHPLPLERWHLLELRQAAQAMAGAPHLETHADFIVYPLN